MLDRADDMLRGWVRSVLGDVPVSLAAPSAGDAEAGGVGLYLMDVAPSPAARGPRRPPLRVAVRYLITSRSADPAAAHRDLGALLVAAMTATEWEVEPAPLPAEAWAAFGVPPRPAVVVRMVMVVPWAEPVAAPPREVKLDAAPQQQIRGAVYRRDGKPVAGATVDWVGLGVSARTDAAGQFVLSAPAGTPVTLRARVGSAEAAYPAGGNGGRGPLVIRVAGPADGGSA